MVRGKKKSVTENKMDSWVQFSIFIGVCVIIAALGLAIAAYVKAEEAQDGVDGIDGSAGADANTTFDRNIASVEDFPPAVEGIISLADGVTYTVTTNVDIGTDRILMGNNSVLRGTYSGSCSVTSAVPGQALISATSSVSISQLTLSATGTGATCISLIGDQNSTSIDWTSVNFQSSNIGTVKDYSNILFTNCGFFATTGPLVISGVTGTVALNQCLFTNQSNTTSIDLQATITRRFRIIYSAFVITGTGIGIDNSSPSIPAESFIIDTCNFSGGSSTYLQGIDITQNAARFIENKGISNSYASGELYMQGNATPTVIAVSGTYTKVLGTTTASSENNKYLMPADNRLTNDNEITATYRVSCTLSFSAGNSETCSFGFYDSTIPGIRTQNVTSAVTNSTGGGGNVAIDAVVNHVAGNYLEIWCTNDSSTTSVLVANMDMIITEST